MSHPDDTSEPAEDIETTAPETEIGADEPTPAGPAGTEASASEPGEPDEDDPYPQTAGPEIGAEPEPEEDGEESAAEPPAQPAPEHESEPEDSPQAAAVEPPHDVPRDVPPKGKKKRARHEGDSLWELAKTVFYALLIAAVVRTVFFQPFNIPSGSMENTLLIGDYLFISKFSYGYSLYSLPWGYWLRRHVDLPGRILASQPERGDIVVFKYPPDNKTDYIKRVIGLPGDRIQMKEGMLYINGKPVPKVRADDYLETDEYGHTAHVPRFKETLPNGVSYYVLDRYPDSGYDTTPVYLVPAGHYFMMGDNRDNSDDSRGHVGMVPFENLEGRARFIWFSIDDSARWFEPWTWFGAIRFDRMGTIVD